MMVLCLEGIVLLKRVCYDDYHRKKRSSIKEVLTKSRSGQISVVDLVAMFV